jgi:hypothetical protein
MHEHEHSCTNTTHTQHVRMHTHTHTHAKFGYKIRWSLLSLNTVDITCDSQFNIAPQRRDMSIKENIK